MALIHTCTSYNIQQLHNSTIIVQYLYSYLFIYYIREAFSQKTTNRFNQTIMTDSSDESTMKQFFDLVEDDNVPPFIKQL
jgi:hypothetical protein